MRPGGLELPTFWFPPQADSIQLSYGFFSLRICFNSSRPFPDLKCSSLFMASERVANSSW